MMASWRRERRQKVFRSVFQTDSIHTCPPSAVFPPSLSSRFPDASAAQVHPVARPRAARIPPPTHPSSDHQELWNQAWLQVTTAIALPSSTTVEDSFGSLPSLSQDHDHHELRNALRLVLHPTEYLPRAQHTEDLLLWHTHQVRRHFVQHVLPLIEACRAHQDPNQVVIGVIGTLEAAHRQYLYGLTVVARGLDGADATTATERFIRDLHAVVGNSMSGTLTDSLAVVLNRLARVVLGVVDSQTDDDGGAADGGAAVDAARSELLGLVSSLARVGLTGEKFHVLFAEMMEFLMDEFVRVSFARKWPVTGVPPESIPPPSPSPSPSSKGSKGSKSGHVVAEKAGPTVAITSSKSCVGALRIWVENRFSRLALEVFARTGGGRVSWAEMERAKDLAVGRLATMRIQELFDMVLHWPDSRADLEDLKASVTTPQRRLQLTDTFSAALHSRLLHPGRSTLDILRVYISMIRTFHALDHSKVLLDRVVRSLQLYLCQRDDAIGIVVTGLLSDPDAGGGDDTLMELAALLTDPSQQRGGVADEELADWDDMGWLPDPVDAGVNYKRPKSEDVIGTLIGALGSQDVFIKEFQAIVAERLLSSRTEFVQETKVLNLLKKRFGESALQNCDVMMRDVQDSRRLDATIRRTIKHEHAAGDVPEKERREMQPPSYHSKILSRLFWPALDREHFVVPDQVAEAQKVYEKAYEQAKASRRLTWLHSLGTATVHLELEDREIETACTTIEAAVIHAFQHHTASPVDDLPAARRTVSGLEETLEMDGDLLREALGFWVSRSVLRQVDSATYVVIERAEDDEGAKHGGETTPGPTTTRKARMGGLSFGLGLGGGGGSGGGVGGSGGGGGGGAGGAHSAEQAEKRSVYWKFIVGMLTNSSPAMPLAQMGMMMKMLVAGFSWSNEDLQELLSEKVAEGEVEFSGGKYRLKKK